MASFTDKLQPFNPYVQQLPVEAMVSVGTAKQGQYDTGVQKIQSSIDNIAGLDIMRDVDKGYLQSKLDTLGNNLKSVAAADFSNYQLTNSVAGMANQIGKDNKIQNAVASTAKVRKEFSLMDEDKKTGKLSPANADFFNKKVNGWLNNPEAGVSFNGAYVPHYDIEKHMREAFAALKEDGYTIDQIFQTDPSTGAVIYKEEKNSKTGETRKVPILSTTMSRLKKTGMFPPKVADTIEQIFNDPNVSQQLQIDGEYNYKGYTPELLANKINQLKTTEYSLYNDKIADLNIEIKGTKDENKKLELQEKIDKIATTRDIKGKVYDNLINSASTNPDAVSGILYKNEASANYMSMYTNVVEERTTENSPAWTAAFNMQKEANEMARHADNLKFNYTKLNQDKDLDILKINADLAGKQTLDDGSMPTINPMSASIDISRVFAENGANSAVIFKTAVDKLIFESDIIPSSSVTAYMKAFPGASLEQAREFVINAAAKSQGLSPEDFRTKWHQYAKNKLNSNPQGLDIEMQNTLQSAETAETTFKDYQVAKKKIDAMAPDPDLTRSLVAFKPFNNGPVLTPELQYDMALAWAGGGLFDSKEMNNKSKEAQKRLEAKGIKSEDIKILMKNLTGNNIPGTVLTIPSMAPAPVEAFLNLVKNIDDKDNTSKFEARVKAIQTIYQFNPIAEKPILTGKEEVDKNHRAKVVNLISTYVGAEQNESNSFIGDAPAMTKVALGEEKGGMKIVATKNEVTGNVVPKLVFSDLTGKTTGEMTITPQEAMSLGHNVGAWYKPAKVKQIEQRIEVMGNGTTAYGNLTDPSTYKSNDVAYAKNDFPNLRNIPQDVRGNLKQGTIVDNEGPHTVYYNYLYVNDEGNSHVSVIGYRNTVDEALQVFDKLTPEAINSYLSQLKK